MTTTYHGHYCGDSDGYADIQTIDLMAAKRLAAGFCQANILKYGSRYGDKGKAIQVCINRFDDETKTAFLELYDKIDADFQMPTGISNEVLPDVDEPSPF